LETALLNGMGKSLLLCKKNDDRRWPWVHLKYSTGVVIYNNRWSDWIGYWGTQTIFKMYVCCMCRWFVFRHLN